MTPKTLGPSLFASKQLTPNGVDAPATPRPVGWQRVFEFGRALGRLARPAGLTDQIGVEVDGDDQTRAHGTADRDRHRVDQGAVDQPLLAKPDRCEHAGHSKRRAHRLHQKPAAELHLVASAEVRGDGGERLGEIVDAQVADVVPQQTHQALAADKTAAAELEIEQSDDSHLVEATRPILEEVEVAAEVDAADEGADRGPADQVGNEPGAFEPAQDAYVRPAAPSARPMRGRSVPPGASDPGTAWTDTI